MCETRFGRNHDNDFCVNANFGYGNAKVRLNQLCQHKVETAKFLQISYSRTTILLVFQIHIYYNTFFFFFFFFFFLRFDSRFFSPLFLSLFFLSLLVSFFSPSSLVALVWFERGCDSKITG